MPNSCFNWFGRIPSPVTRLTLVSNFPSGDDPQSLDEDGSKPFETDHLNRRQPFERVFLYQAIPDHPRSSQLPSQIISKIIPTPNSAPISTAQSARSLGVPSYSQAAVSHAVRHASRDTRGLPSAEEVVAAIHGNLSGARRQKGRDFGEVWETYMHYNIYIYIYIYNTPSHTHA